MLIVEPGYRMLLATFIQRYCPQFVHAMDYAYRTPLFMCKDVEEVAALVACGADVDHKPLVYMTPIRHFAAFGGTFDKIQCLLDHGANDDGLAEHVPGPRIEAWTGTIRRMVEDYRQREATCRASIYAYILCLRQRRRQHCGIPRDLVGMLAKLVWPTRRQAVWNATSQHLFT